MGSQPHQAAAEFDTDKRHGGASTGTVSSHVARLVLHTALRLGVSTSEATHLPGLTRNQLDGDLVRPPTTSLLRLWELITTAARENAPGLHVAEQAKLGSLHVWDYLFTSGATLADGARQAAEHLHLLVDPSATMSVTADGAQLTIHYCSETSWTPAADAIHEFILSLILRRCREAVGRTIVPLHVGFAHNAPRSHRSLAGAFGTGHLDFARPANSITFLASDTQQLRAADPELARILRRYAEMTASRVRPLPNWRDNFDDALAVALTEATPSLRHVAYRLSISPRTVQRRLAEYGTSWQDELDTARQARAERLLAENRLPLSTVAARLGYTDVRSLRRAVKRWDSTNSLPS
jgi:AraC-like DNA-binding protein